VAKRSDTEQAVLDSLGTEWRYRYLDFSDSLSRRLDRLWAERFPGRRNRPSHRNIEAALTRLVKEGVIEHKQGEHDDLYRKVGE
jgi:hypothetical protein